MTTSKQVGPLYQKVMEDVITNVQEAFLDEGVDEQILLELKLLWEKKLAATKALEHGPELQTARSDPATRQTSQDRGTHSQKQQRPHGNPPVILAAAPQPTQQTIPVSLIASQPEGAGATAAPAAAQSTVAVPLGVAQPRLAALGVASQGGVSLQVTADGQLVAVQNIGGQLVAAAIPQQLVIRREPVQAHTAAGGEQVAAVPAEQHSQQNSSAIIQLDGGGDGSSSSEEDDDFVDENCDDNEEEQNEDEAEQAEAETPLNSEDDVSEEDSSEVFDTENVVVCQYDKINRNKNRWKFNLKDGIMSLNGKDFVFQRASGDAEW